MEAIPTVLECQKEWWAKFNSRLFDSYKEKVQRKKYDREKIKNQFKNGKG